MKNMVITDKEKNTISGVFHIEREATIGSKWKMKATIEISDMPPSDFARIHKLSESISEELVYGLCLHAMDS